MTDTAVEQERITRRDLAEGRTDKVLTERTAMVSVDDVVGGLKFENALQIAEAAKIMATSGSMLPPWLQGNVGGCWGIILRSIELRMSPMTLASMTYEVENKGVKQVAYMSNFFRTIVEQRARIKEKRLRTRYEGTGDEMVCFVYATFEGEDEPCEWPPKEAADQYTLKKLRPGRNDRGQIRGSPLWETKPAQQIFYAMSRDWARVYCSSLVAGMYTEEELREQEARAQTAKDVTPQKPAEVRARLRGREGREGFHTDISKSIDDAISRARGEPTLAPMIQGEVTETRDGTEDKAPPANSSDVAAPPAASGAATQSPADQSDSSAASSERSADEPAGDGNGVKAHAPSSADPSPQAAGQPPAAEPPVTPSLPPTESPADKDAAVAAAHQRGVDDRKAGRKRSASPIEWRGAESTALAVAWISGWKDEDERQRNLF